jgi:tRNA pseudouridine38-40 synthase
MEARRYFVEVSYKGNRYAGFQVQRNANTVQAEVEKAFETFFRQKVVMTGSSRTDAGVHALQNYFHCDVGFEIDPLSVYNLNALLPADIAVKKVVRVREGAHCRYEAVSRRYRYTVYRFKDPFVDDRGYYFPYTLDGEAMREVSGRIMGVHDFTSFAKRRTQVKTFECDVQSSEWRMEGSQWIYEVEANRFLRGMVRGLVGTMLQVGRGMMSVEGFEAVLKARDNRRADFSVPGHGLMLMEVKMREDIFV